MTLLMPKATVLIREERCERCKHCAAASNGAANQIECRRFPPQIVAAAPGQIVALFPLVDPGASCGEFARKQVLDS